MREKNVVHAHELKILRIFRKFPKKIKIIFYLMCLFTKRTLKLSEKWFNFENFDFKCKAKILVMLKKIM